MISEILIFLILKNGERNERKAVEKKTNHSYGKLVSSLSIDARVSLIIVNIEVRVGLISLYLGDLKIC